jgi:hypothetical protein
MLMLLCRCAAGGRSALPGRDAGDGGGPAAAHGGAGQAGRTPAHLPAVPAPGARPTRGLQEAPRLPGRRSLVSQIPRNVICTPTKLPATKCSAKKDLATKGPATKGRGHERSGARKGRGTKIPAAKSLGH